MMVISNNQFSKSYTSAEDVSRLVANDINTFVSQYNLDIDALNNIELCLVELVNNTFEHAYSMEDGHVINVTCDVSKSNSFTFKISDFGHSMSEDAFKSAVSADFVTPDPDKPETWTTSGRGFIIVEELTDKFDYISDGKKNSYVFTKHITN